MTTEKIQSPSETAYTDYSDVNEEDETTRQAGPMSRGSRSSDEGLKFEEWQHRTDRSLTFETRSCGAKEVKSTIKVKP